MAVMAILHKPSAFYVAKDAERLWHRWPVWPVWLLRLWAFGDVPFRSISLDQCQMCA